ncbi:hypothetical protein KIH74_12120 [Kineosporia sp. J2-2]|uniref:Uncharacterized protein n=1 Tax=Kineosporia corallincola TaxID=2835133 RepID=A0ABS5TJC7_9ACTN|nr:hypothetical protein [Kineosporia corallincola]MBT0769674.1 hypothetical protein [Kineosporia corallincola]
MTVNETTGAGAGRHLAQPSTASAPPDDLVTRLLCAACYLHDDIADSAVSALLRPTRRALSPNWQVDHLALARHAARARQLRDTRDSWLNREIWYVTGTAFIALLLTVSGVLGPFNFVLIVLFLLFWAYVVAVGIVYFQMRAARRSAIGVALDPAADPPPPLRHVSTEEALRDLNHCNVVLYRADSQPFVGSGVKLDGWQITIDISRRTRAGAGPVTGAELQAALLEMLPGRISPRPTGGHRLYVRGGAGSLAVDLYRYGPVERNRTEQLNFRRPVAWLPRGVLRPYFDRRDENARVYTCFQQSTWGGQVVVTLFVHAHVANQTLFVEGQVYALRPLHSELYEVRTLPVGTAPELQALGPIALTEATSLLLNAPSEIMKKSRTSRLRTSNAVEADNEIAQRRDVDFGAVRSVREQVSNFDLGEHFAAGDEELFYQVFTRRSLECVEEFLTSRGVDTAEFSGQSTEIISKATANARSVYGESAG